MQDVKVICGYVSNYLDNNIKASETLQAELDKGYQIAFVTQSGDNRVVWTLIR